MAIFFPLVNEIQHFLATIPDILKEKENQI